jgi:hypothetical protein
MTIANPFSSVPREPGSPPVVTPKRVPLPTQNAFSELRPKKKSAMELNAPPGFFWNQERGEYSPSDPSKEYKAFILPTNIDQDIQVAETLSKLPKFILSNVEGATIEASELVDIGLEKLGKNQDYSPPSLPRIRVELLGDAKKKFPGVVSVKKVHEQILVQGIQVLGQRMAKVQIELIEGIEKSVEEFAKKTAVTLGVKIFAKAAVFAVLKELIDTVAKGLSAYGNAKTQAKIEAGIREESAASMIKFAKRAAYDQHRKFKDGATRVAKIVMSRQPKKSDATT